MAGARQFWGGRVGFPPTRRNRYSQAIAQSSIPETIEAMLSVEEIMVSPPAEGQVVDPMSWFATPGPLELEIGCGKGGFLLSRALANPDVRLLGIEWANKFYRYAAERMARRGVSNVRLMRTDAAEFVRFHLPAACLSILHLYHPDPWPKKRHHKRRLVQQPFVTAAVRAIVPGGKWFIQSDHAEYFAQMHGLLAGHGELAEIPWEMGEIAGPEWSGTNFEIKYVREGRAIHRAGFVRKG